MREIQITVTVRYLLTRVRMSIPKEQTVTGLSEDVGELEHWLSVQCVAAVGNRMEAPQEITNRTVP